MIFIKRGQRSIVLGIICLLFGLSSCDSGSDQEQPSSGDADNANSVNSAGGSSTTAASNAAPSSSGPSVVVETLPYAEIGDELVYGYFAFPSDMVEPIPAVILIHDRWGLDEPTRDLSRRLADEGYIVMAIDLFGGEVAETPGPARILEISVFENPQIAAENIRQAYDFVKETFRAPSVASLGFGFGGGWSLNAAMLLPEDLNASVIFYGQVTDDERKLAAVQAPLLGLFGENDRVITATSVAAFENALQTLEKEFHVAVFAGAGRGFADPRSDNFSAETAARAWVRMLEFLGQHTLRLAEAREPLHILTAIYFVQNKSEVPWLSYSAPCADLQIRLMSRGLDV